MLTHLVDHIVWHSMSLCRIVRHPFLKLYFDVPRKSPKNTCLCVYTAFKAISACICSFWAKNYVHQEMCMKTIFFGIFLIESWITWLLAFHIPWKCLDSTLPYLFGVLYIEPLGYIEGGETGEQGKYCSLLPHLFMLESASLCPFGAHSVALPKISFDLWSFHWEMEDWGGGGLGFYGS